MTQLDQESAAKGGFAAFRQGFSAPWHGLVFMCQRPLLWRYGLAPVLLNLAITGLMLILLASAVTLAVPSIHSWFVAKGYATYWEILAFGSLLVLALGLVLAIWKLLEGILCGHFYGRLAREVELQLGAPPEALKEIPFRFQVVDSARDFAALAVINLGLLMMNCVPVIGSLIGLVGALYFDWLILGASFFAFPIGLRGSRRTEIRRFCRQHRSHTLGLGAAVLLFSLIPLVGAVLLTTAATGAVLLHRRLSPTEAWLPAALEAE